MASGSKTKHMKQHMQKIADFGCIICYKMGYPNTPCELHHIKDKTGMGKKASNYEVIGLCPTHHRQGKESYHFSPKAFTEKNLSKKIYFYLEHLLDLDILFVDYIGLQIHLLLIKILNF